MGLDLLWVTAEKAVMGSSLYFLTVFPESKRFTLYGLALLQNPYEQEEPKGIPCPVVKHFWVLKMKHFGTEHAC